jgi:hypothetical protein
MKRDSLENMKGGWFIGNFQPNIHESKDFEVTIRHYLKGETEPRHYQLIATEITVIVLGKARMGDQILNPNEVLTVFPTEVLDFEALEDCTIVAIKFPSIPSDKILA